MQTFPSTAALLYRKVGEALIGLPATYKDYKLHDGNKEYSKLREKTK